MNANELAGLLEVDSWYKLVTREEIAAMLRTIPALEAEIEALKAKTLTDEEIFDVWEMVEEEIGHRQLKLNFARAILRKASE